MSTGIPQISINLQIASCVIVDDISIFTLKGGGKHEVFEHVKCQIVSFISPSDAKVRDLSARVYGTKASVCHAFTVELRHAENIFNT